MATTAAAVALDDPDGIVDPPVPPVTTDLTDIVAGAVEGSQAAWNTLMERFGSMVMGIARSYRLGPADSAEVHQATWLRLVENIGRIQQPERVGAWLGTTARRESLRMVRARSRVSFDTDALSQHPDTALRPVDDGLIAVERAAAVREAMGRLPTHCRRLLEMVARTDPPSYREISETLDMPVGSIGPTRGRCLAHLRRILEDSGAEL
jgi:RNA polymerase sigma factor (sigma-70 family)